MFDMTVQRGLGSSIVSTANEAGSSQPIISPNDIDATIRELAVAKEVVFTGKGNDRQRLVSQHK